MAGAALRRRGSVGRAAGGGPADILLSRAPQGLRKSPVAPTAAEGFLEDILMQRSTNRILTTHTGSLPRPAPLVQLLIDDREKPGANRAALEAAVRDAVAGVVAKQIECGLDIINDGEQGRTDYTVHVKDRLSGFEGPSSEPRGTGEDEFPELALLLKQFASPFQYRPACSGPIGWKDWPAVEADLARAKSATESATAGDGARQAFMTSPSPGQIARYLKNGYYPDDEAYLTALADIMKREYQAIVDAGFILQLDCPDLAMSRHMLYPHLSIADYRKVIAANVTALNRAVADIPAERMRMHVCWGSTIDPHHNDVPLRDIVDVVLSAKPQAVSFPGANPRHGHEWKVWREVALPPEKIIIPGVIDSTTNVVEHSELVADRIVQYARVVGPQRVIAGVDCGFGTFAGRVQVDTKIVWMKLKSLAEGAALASRQLW
jgi:5-methyltetrahydropteroyltriglutamate--homocysteine methyltransferase